MKTYICIDCKKPFQSKTEDDVCNKCGKKYTFSDNVVQDLRYENK